jgi:hypothetical protein
MVGGGAAARGGEHAAEGIIAKAAQSTLRDAVGPTGRAVERDAARGAATHVGDEAARGAENAASHLGEAQHYEFNMVENPGPLAGDEYGRAAQNFAGGRYNAEVTSEDTVLFRAGEKGTPLGQYFTREPPVGELQARIDNAVERVWRDGEGHYQGTSIVNTGYAVHIPKGTTIFTGPVASRGGALVGGAKDQIFVLKPWEIDGLHAIDSWPLP